MSFTIFYNCKANVLFLYCFCGVVKVISLFGFVNHVKKFKKKSNALRCAPYFVYFRKRWSRMEDPFFSSTPRCFTRKQIFHFVLINIKSNMLNIKIFNIQYLTLKDICKYSIFEGREVRLCQEHPGKHQVY